MLPARKETPAPHPLITQVMQGLTHLHGALDALEMRIRRLDDVYDEMRRELRQTVRREHLAILETLRRDMPRQSEDRIAAVLALAPGLQRRRKALGLSQRDLATYVILTRSVISGVERGTRRNPATIERLDNALARLEEVLQAKEVEEREESHNAGA